MSQASLPPESLYVYIFHLTPHSPHFFQSLHLFRTRQLAEEYMEAYIAIIPHTTADVTILNPVEEKAVTAAAKRAATAKASSVLPKPPRKPPGPRAAPKAQAPTPLVTELHVCSTATGVRLATLTIYRVRLHISLPVPATSTGVDIDYDVLFVVGKMVGRRYVEASGEEKVGYFEEVVGVYDRREMASQWMAMVGENEASKGEGKIWYREVVVRK